MNEKLKNILKVLVFIFIVVFIIYIYLQEDEEVGPILVSYSELSNKEKVELLEEEQEKYIEKINELENKLQELQKKYEEAEDLIYILREQLISYGIEPNEL